ncbi:F-box protein AUF2-like [Rhododendron vialii]|uniref:F-box protein AUF2-like n=1 Tax=Rhododendron vialii TaxID=182163 RepID=UPI00265FA35A|nr:F-box protein AUF2-like [Rhododendron vialii]
MSSVHGAKEEEEAENQFHRLPDDVLLNIFDKVSDFRGLCRCFLVSKRFASLVPRVQTLSVASDISPVQTASEQFSLRLHISGLVFLAKLTQIRALSIEIRSDFVDDNDSVFKWGANFTQLDSVTVLYATSLSKMTGSEEEEADTENGITQEEVHRRKVVAVECIKGAIMWVGTLGCVVLDYPMLQSVTICDSMSKGVKLCLGGEKLVEFRNALDLEWVSSLGERAESWTQENMKVGYVPVLELPVSGYVMKGVTVVNFRMFADDNSEVETAMVDAFAEEQGVFVEAVVQILEKHRNGIEALLHN